VCPTTSPSDVFTFQLIVESTKGFGGASLIFISKVFQKTYFILWKNAQPSFEIMAFLMYIFQFESLEMFSFTMQLKKLAKFLNPN
jgi:hypothetical protein